MTDFEDWRNVWLSLKATQCLVENVPCRGDVPANYFGLYVMDKVDSALLTLWSEFGVEEQRSLIGEGFGLED